MTVAEDTDAGTEGPGLDATDQHRSQLLYTAGLFQSLGLQPKALTTARAVYIRDPPPCYDAGESPLRPRRYFVHESWPLSGNDIVKSIPYNLSYKIWSAYKIYSAIRYGSKSISTDRGSFGL